MIISEYERLNLECEIQDIVLNVYPLVEYHEASQISGCVINLLLNKGILGGIGAESKTTKAQEDTSMAEGT